jgi:hypothetical protein
MANTNLLQRITKRAKQIQREHPKMNYRVAQRQAASELKKKKKVGAIKKRAVKRKVIGRTKTVRKIKPVRKRIGSVSPVKRLEDQLGKEYVKFYNETTIRGTDISRKKIAEIKRELKKLKKIK